MITLSVDSFFFYYLAVAGVRCYVKWYYFLSERNVFMSKQCKAMIRKENQKGIIKKKEKETRKEKN